MYLDDINNANRSASIAALYAEPKVDKRTAQNEELATPFSWGSDTVSISPEAMDAARRAAAVAAQASSTAAKAGAQDISVAPGENTEESEAVQTFAAYMNKARGASASASSPEEQIKALRDKLSTLENTMAQITAGGGGSKNEDGSTSLANNTKSSQIEALTSQISAVQAQISELESLLAEQKKQQG